MSERSVEGGGGEYRCFLSGDVVLWVCRRLADKSSRVVSVGDESEKDGGNIEGYI